MSDRQIRSYHRAFRGELIIYSFGRDLRPWRPIPARGIFWVSGLILSMFIVLHVVQISLPLFSLPWAVAYLGIPGGLGWLLTVGKIEGRRVHVAAGAWIRHSLRGRDSVGGYRRLPTLATPRQGKVRVAESYALESRRLRIRHIALALPIILLGMILLLAHGTHKPRRTGASPARVRTVAAPALPPILAVTPTPSPVTRKHVAHFKHAVRPRHHDASPWATHPDGPVQSPPPRRKRRSR